MGCGFESHALRILNLFIRNDFRHFSTCRRFSKEPGLASCLTGSTASLRSCIFHVPSGESGAAARRSARPATRAASAPDSRPAASRFLHRRVVDLVYEGALMNLTLPLASLPLAADSNLQERERAAATARAEIERRNPQDGVRTRLLARQAARKTLR